MGKNAGAKQLQCRHKAYLPRRAGCYTGGGFNSDLTGAQGYSRGFTLIELMIAVAILGILVSIAYPSYQRYITNTWRTTAQACLMDMAQTMERRFAANMGYVTVVSGASDVLFQSGCSDESGMPARYTFSFTAATSLAGGTYTLQAVPQVAQQSDDCQTLSLTQASVKGVSNKTKSVDQCW